MKIEQYYTPDIEDIRVGGNYEVFSIGRQIDEYGLFLSPEKRDDELKWREYIGKSASDVLHLSIYLQKQELRVPYLTKEQIEAEGWYCTNHVELNFQRIISDDLWWELDYNIDTHDLTIECWKENHITNKSDCFTKFEGECKSINEFHYVCKLLKI